MILSRYLKKEIVITFLAVTLVLLLMFLSNALVRYLRYIAAGKVAANILFNLIGLEIPYLLAFLLPLSLYLGIILTYGKLYADSELRVMQACGLSMNQLTLITVTLSLWVTGLVTVLTLWVNPWIASEKARLVIQDNILDTVMPGRFQVTNDGQRVLYVEKIHRKAKQADNIFIADQGKHPSNENVSAWTVVSAASGAQVTDHKTHMRYVVANNGSRYEGLPGKNDYKIVHFEKYAVRVPSVDPTSKRQEQEAIPTTTLWNEYQKAENAAELQWRLSIPLSTFLLSLLAIPFSYVQPRRGRYSQLLPALLVYFIYVNLLFLSRNWVELKTLPISLGVWWVHGMALILFLALSTSIFTTLFKKTQRLLQMSR